MPEDHHSLTHSPVLLLPLPPPLNQVPGLYSIPATVLASLALNINSAVVSALVFCLAQVLVWTYNAPISKEATTPTPIVVSSLSSPPISKVTRPPPRQWYHHHGHDSGVIISKKKTST